VKFLNSKNVKFLLSLIFSGLILYFLYRNFSLGNIVELISTIDLFYFSIFILLIFTQLLIATFRWKRITGKLVGTKMGMFKSWQVVIGSYSANLIIPAKMGEFVRVIWEKDAEKRKYILRLVIFEKLLDVFSIYLIYAVSLSFVLNSSSRIQLYLATVAVPLALLFFFLLLLKQGKVKQFIPGKILLAIELIKEIVRTKKHFFQRLLFISIFLWVIQVGQFILIFYSMNVYPGILEAYAGNSLAVLAGAFIPSIGGIGPRDATIVWFFAELANKALLTTIGLMTALRVIIPAFIGLPFFFNLTRKS
jgi:uncharacterized membrane protein YbhN (UPF0104 family)